MLKGETRDERKARGERDMLVQIYCGFK